MSLIPGVIDSTDYSANSRFIDGEGRIYWNPRRMEFPLISMLGLMGRTGSDLTMDGMPMIGAATGGKKDNLPSALGKRKVLNAKFLMFTNESMERSSAVNNAAGYSSSATSIVVDDGTLFSKYDQVYVPRTGEIMVVSAVSSNTLTVTRGVGSTAAALLDNDGVFRLAAGYPVNSLSGNARATVPAEAYNYTQIFRTPIAIGRTDKDSQYNYATSPNEEARLIKEAAYDHNFSQELAFWYGRKAEVTAVDGSGARERFTGGIFENVTTNVMDISASGTLSEATLDAFAEMAFDRGSDEKIMFCAPRVLSKINSLAKDKLRLSSPKENMYGLDLAEYMTAHGKLLLARTSHFGRGALGAEYESYGVVIDPQQIKFAHLNQAENELRMNVQENDRDGVKHEWLVEAGLQITNETTHAILKGVVA